MRFLYLSTCLAFVSFSSHAKTLGLEMLWNGMPVSPACFSALDPAEGNGPSEINLSECSANVENIKKEDNHRFAIEYAEGGYDLYAINDVKGNDYLVTYIWNGGGAGHFSSGMLVTTDEGILKVKERIPGGDRCNGGLISLKLDDDGKALATRWATPSDFPYIAYGEDRGIEPYRDLEGSASSCVAKVTEKDDALVSVELADMSTEESEWVNSYTYQKCFNSIVASQRKNKAVLEPDEFKKFMDEFFAQCVGNGKGSNP
ncbi:MAG: hypothetical protein RBR86_08425 [Pseudobdellovibrionaceae bacterium]|jgi:hypothetical protein|nr:hypothetical protein [Pseudobdellovibrionaceae bacterium]